MSKKFLIIAPNFERGKCGISDYTWILRDELKNETPIIFVLAISDSFISIPVQSEHDYRIPHGFSDKNRLELIKEVFIKISPTHILFNFELYGFQKKGLPFFLFPIFSLFAKSQTTIVFHELWTGLYRTENFKNKFYGVLQHMLFTRLFKLYHINRLVTTTTMASSILKKMRMPSKFLPVFSNIYPIHPPELYRDNVVRVVFFGSSGFKIDKVKLETLFNEIIALKLDVEFHLVGKFNINLIDWESQTKIFGHFLKAIKKYDFLDFQSLSDLLYNSSIAVTTYVEYFWSKSGAIASLISHDVPIVSIAENISLSSKYFDANKIFYENKFIGIEQIKDSIKWVKSPRYDYNKGIGNSLRNIIFNEEKYTSFKI